TYYNCRCVNYNLTDDDIVQGMTYMGVFGKCEYSCKWLTTFLFLFTFMIVFVFITSMPSLTATLRCVPDHQRSFGLGIQWIVARCLGSIPGPILFGKMFDLACLVWQKRCDGEGSCFFYDNHNMSVNLLSVAIFFSLKASLSFFVALFYYRAHDEEIVSVYESVSEVDPKGKTWLLDRSAVPKEEQDKAVHESSSKAEKVSSLHKLVSKTSSLFSRSKQAISKEDVRSQVGKDDPEDGLLHHSNPGSDDR
ncbi:solute carrier organic anion transporter family member 1B7, partial [Biomphalaria glabrata]